MLASGRRGIGDGVPQRLRKKHVGYTGTHSHSWLLRPPRKRESCAIGLEHGPKTQRYSIWDHPSSSGYGVSGGSASESARVVMERDCEEVKGDHMTT